jgi:rod shape-determining protein MreB
MGLLSDNMLFRTNIGLDLGTSNTRIYIEGRGLVLDEPSVVAYNLWEKKVIAVGDKAKQYVGRTPQQIKTIYPLRDGMIIDFKNAKSMIKVFLKNVHKGRKLLKPKIVITVPSSITDVEKKAIRDAVSEVGGGKVFFMPAVIAAALGAGVDINENNGNIIVNLGGGVCEIAVIINSTVVFSEIIRIAGTEIDEEIKNAIRDEYNADIGKNTAEKCKIAIGSAMNTGWVDPSYTIMAKDIYTNASKEFVIDTEKLCEAIQEPVHSIINLVEKGLDVIPANHLKDAENKGLILVGGTSLLNGLDVLLETKTGFDFRVAPDPLLTVIKGCGSILKSIKKYKNVFI